MVDVGGHLLCVDCNLKLAEAHHHRQEGHYLETVARYSHINHLLGQMESIAGTPNLFPRYQLPNPPVRIGPSTMNEVNVSQSNVGILNTGHIEQITASFNAVNKECGRETVEALRKLVSAVKTAEHVEHAIRNQVLENLSFIAQQASIQAGSRQKSIGKQCLETLDSVLPRIADIATIWSTAYPLLAAIFA